MMHKLPSVKGGCVIRIVCPIDISCLAQIKKKQVLTNISKIVQPNKMKAGTNLSRRKIVHICQIAILEIYGFFWLIKLFIGFVLRKP